MVAISFLQRRAIAQLRLVRICVRLAAIHAAASDAIWPRCFVRYRHRRDLVGLNCELTRGERHSGMAGQYPQAQSEEFASLLMAWYTSGYHTGRYHALYGPNAPPPPR